MSLPFFSQPVSPRYAPTLPPPVLEDLAFAGGNYAGVRDGFFDLDRLDLENGDPNKVDLKRERLQLVWYYFGILYLSLHSRMSKQPIDCNRYLSNTTRKPGLIRKSFGMQRCSEPAFSLQ